jgi:hypothetical protein
LKSLISDNTVRPDSSSADKNIYDENNLSNCAEVSSPLKLNGDLSPDLHGMLPTGDGYGDNSAELPQNDDFLQTRTRNNITINVVPLSNDAVLKSGISPTPDIINKSLSLIYEE